MTLAAIVGTLYVCGVVFAWALVRAGAQADQRLERLRALARETEDE